MASLCKRQQCTIERRGFRQELDSWRHKLIHCVGFESILEGLFGSGLVEDLTLFKDCEPEGVSDWSFHENCLFCCLRRDKVKEHLSGLSNQGQDSESKPLLVKEQSKINRLEKQAEEFLSAVFYKKDVPSFSDPHIPVVAREIMQRMIRQFAAEYTSKTSSSQDSSSAPQPSIDQSLLRPPSVVPPAASPGPTTAASAHNQNPVLSKLLMADQDSPLDLTIKKPPVEPTEQDGVLDLSLKKGQSSQHVRSPHLSQATPTLRGESTELCATKAQDLQSTSTLEQFMAKLCPHHQKQIVDALGFLQTEVKAVNSSSSSQASNPNPALVDLGSISASPESGLDTPEKKHPDPRLPLTSTPNDHVQIQEMAGVSTSTFASPEKISETAASLHILGTGGPPLDLRKNGSEAFKVLGAPLKSTIQGEVTRPSDHFPLKIKIMKSSSLGDGKKLSCVLTTSITPPTGTLEERQANTDLSKRAESHSARLSSSVKRRHYSDHSQQARQRGTIGHSKVTPSKPCTAEKTLSSISPMSPRTARKTMRRSSYYRPRDSSVFIADPDLGHCDLVYIDKPITESLRRNRHRMHPRRTARKSTRGHLYVEEMWELKTVRTLSGKSQHNDNLGGCPIAPMPDLISMGTVTPKQVLSKPDGVPPVDLPIAEGCSETVSQKTPSEQLSEKDISGVADEVAAAFSDANLTVETSQTDQSQCKVPIVDEQFTVTDSEPARGNTISEESLSQTVAEPAGQDVSSAEVLSESGAEVVETKAGVKLMESDATEETELLSGLEEIQNSDSEPQQEIEGTNSLVECTEEKKEEVEEGNNEKEKAVEVQPAFSVIQEHANSSERKDQSCSEVHTEQELKEVEEVDMAKPDQAAADVATVPEEHRIDPLVHFSPEKSLEALLKELPPWRRKRQEKSQPKPIIISEAEKIIVGYVNGRPIKASDRCLRRRSQKSTPEPAKSPSNQSGPESSPVPSSPAESIKIPLLKRLVKAQEKSSVKPTEISPVNVSLTDSVENLAAKPLKRSPGKVSRKMLQSKTLSDAGQNVHDSLLAEDPVTMPAPELETLPDPVSGSLSAPALVPESHPAPESVPVPAVAPFPDNTVDSPKTPESTRPLRSARLKLDGAVVSPPQLIDMALSASERASTSLPSQPTSFPSHSTDPLLPQNIDLSPLPISSPSLSLSLTSIPIEPSPLPISSPPVTSPLSLSSTSPPVLAEFQPIIATQTTEELSVETIKTAPDTKPTKKMKKSGVESRVLTRQKLRSSGLVKEPETAETTQTTTRIPLLTDSPVVVKSEATAQSGSLRGKRTPQKDREASKLTLQKVTPSTDDKISSGVSCISPSPDRPGRMPLRSESSKAEVEASHSATLAVSTPSSPSENRKSALRSQRLATPSPSRAAITAENPREVSSPFRVKPERIMKLPAKFSPVSSLLSSSSLPSCSGLPLLPPRLEPPTPTPPKFLEALNSGEHQHLINNLNLKFDKMQKGWFQMDKEGQLAPKHKNKADRQAAIWKSKRRVRKPRSLENQRYSPVQMLFMKKFDLGSICRWFLESTETKSLVIVKKVNTRLPSETQLCFHSSSGLPGTSQGVFPSLQAERLKKHLKKFAIASPVKSTPKNQKLIAKTLEQEVTMSKGKDKKELTTATRISTKPYTTLDETQTVEAQKASAKTKNPTSARILRKYTNIREKMQVQQTSKKDSPRESLRASNVKTSNGKPKLATVKGAKPCLKGKKSMIESVVAKSGRGRPSLGRKLAKEEGVAKRSSSRTVKEPTRKDDESSQKSPQRPLTPKTQINSSALAALAETDFNKKQVEATEKVGADSLPVKAGAGAKEKQTKRLSQSRVTVAKGAESPLGTPLQDTDATTTPASDQVLTRSQRKMEVMSPQSGSLKSSTKKSQETLAQRGTPKSATKKTEESTHTQKGTPKAVKRGQRAMQTPAKRTRMSLAK